MGNALGVKPPFTTGFGELHVAEISESHVGCVLSGKHFASKEDFEVGHRSAFALFPQLDNCVQMTCVSLHPVGDQYILKAVEIDIDEHRTPGPIRCGDTGEVGTLGE